MPVRGRGPRNRTIAWRITALTLALLAALMLPGQSPGTQRATAGEDLDQRIRRAGLQPNREAIVHFLQGLRPTPDQQRMVDLLIGQLGSSDYSVREEATRRLIAMPTAGQASLLEATRSDEPEISFRAQQVLDARQSGQFETQVHASLLLIARDGYPGLTELLLDLVRLIDEPYLMEAAVDALAAGYRLEDEPLLRGAISDRDTRVREVAIRTTARVLGPAIADELVAMDRDASARVRLVAAESLARIGDTRCLRSLGRLLSEPDEDIANRAGSLLRSVTGEQFGFWARQEETQRAEAIARWMDWIEQHESGFALLELGREFLLGRTLVTLYSHDRVIEYNDMGEIVWQADLPNAFACQGLPNGHRLIAQYASGRIVEFDQAGEEVWSVDGLPGNLSGIHRTPEGTTLVAAGQAGNMLIELNRAKERVWEISVPGTPVHAVRLENGMTLVALMNENKIVEVDREGTRSWEVGVRASPYQLQRIPNGNTIVRFSGGGAAEYTRDGEEIWSVDCEDGYTAQRFEDGSTLISDNRGFRVHDPSGNVIEETGEYTGYLYVHRY